MSTSCFDREDETFIVLVNHEEQQPAEGMVRLRCGGCNASVDVIDEVLHQGVMRAAQAHGLPAGGPITVQVACTQPDCARCDNASSRRAGAPARPACSAPRPPGSSFFESWRRRESMRAARTTPKTNIVSL